jgi:hypothetical protein
MFSIAKMIFFIIQSAQKYNSNIKKFRPKDSNRRLRGRRLCTLPLRRRCFHITRRSA